MNSEKLSQQHQSVYQSFFSHSEKIFSLPLVMNWCGDISGENMIHILSRLPLRIYFGVNIRQSGGVKLGTITSYKPAEETFHTTNIREHIPHIESICSEITRQYPDTHVEISVLSETSRSMGVGFTPIILFGIFLALRTAKEKDILQMCTESSQKWATEYNTNQTLKILIRDFLTLVKPYRLSGSIFNILASFFADAYPFCGFASGIWPDIIQNDAAIYSFSLRDFLPPDAPSIPYHSMDISLFYSGQPVFTEQVLSGLQPDTSWLDHAQVLIRNTIERHPHEIMPYMEPPFLRQWNDFTGEQLRKKYADILSLQTLEIFENMIEMYLHSYDEDQIKNFLQKLNKITWVNYITRVSAKSVKRLKSRLGYLFKNYITKTASFPNDTTIMGGCIVIASPIENIRKETEQNLRELNEQTPESALVYMSWQDGFEDIWFHLDQDVWSAYMSPYASNNIGIFEYLDGRKQIVSVQELDTLSRDLIIFDTLRSKIIANRKTFTSKDLPSQQATCEIMKTLMLSWWTISNSKLTRSAYSQSKNDMQGKIFTPLNKLCQILYWKKFPIKITGSSDDFILELEKGKTEKIVLFYEI